MVNLAGFPLVTRKLGAPLCRLPAKDKEEASSTKPIAEKFEIPTSTEVRLYSHRLCFWGRFGDADLRAGGKVALYSRTTVYY